MKTAKKNILVTTVACIFLVAGYNSVIAQNDAMQNNKNDSSENYSQIEETQDQIEDVTMKIYDYYEDYPDFSYTYNYNDKGELESVKIVGVGDKEDMQALQKDLTQLANLREKIKNQANRIDVYYVTETMPKPEEGYEDFYDELYSEITYPENAIDNRIEGTVYVKFLVGENGNVLLATADNNIDAESYNQDLVDKMQHEAIAAVKETSGDWTPGKIGGIPVTQWMMVPVEYDTKTNPFLRPLY